MIIVSLILTIISCGITVYLIRRTAKLSSYNFVIGKLVNVEVVQDSYSKSYEATYKYDVNGRPRIFTSDKHKKKPEAFDKEIKLYYKNDINSIFEKPSNDITKISMLLTGICLIAFILYAVML